MFFVAFPLGTSIDSTNRPAHGSVFRLFFLAKIQGASGLALGNEKLREKRRQLTDAHADLERWHPCFWYIPNGVCKVWSLILLLFLNVFCIPFICYRFKYPLFSEILLPHLFANFGLPPLPGALSPQSTGFPKA